MESNQTTFYQSKVDTNLLMQFREIQNRQGRTNKWMLEEFMNKTIDDENKRMGNANRLNVSDVSNCKHKHTPAHPPTRSGVGAAANCHG